MSSDDRSNLDSIVFGVVGPTRELSCKPTHVEVSSGTGPAPATPLGHSGGGRAESGTSGVSMGPWRDAGDRLELAGYLGPHADHTP